MSSVKNYDPFSFFYIGKEELLNDPTNGCQALAKANVDCSDIGSNLDSCYTLRLCENRDKAEAFRYIKENNNTSVQKYNDTNNEYTEEIMNTINLTVGIVFLSGVILKNYFS